MADGHRHATITAEAAGRFFPHVFELPDADQSADNRPPYSINRVVGSGVSGTAFMVTRRQDGKRLIAKITDLSSMDARKRQYARSEIRCLGQCSHFAIVHHYESHGTADHLLLIMELADAGDLHRHIKTRQGRQRGEAQLFAEHEVAFLFLQILLAIDYIHDRRMLHRDIKSANVFLMSYGVTKLGDFGFSQQYEDTVSKAVGETFCGTPYYLAPELWRRQRYSKKADVWALGVLLYEMAALRRPFVGDSMLQLMDSVMGVNYAPLPDRYSEAMCDVVRRILCFDPNQRPDTRQLLGHDYVRYVAENFEKSVEASPNFSEDDKFAMRASLQHSMSFVTVSHALAQELAGSNGGDRALAAPGGGIVVGEVQEAVRHRGLVQKKSSDGGWRERYLVLAGGELTISLASAPGHDTRTLPLRDVCGVTPVESAHADGRTGAFGIAVAVQNRTPWLLFQAPSDEECSIWIGRLQAALGEG